MIFPPTEPQRLFMCRSLIYPVGHIVHSPPLPVVPTGNNLVSKQAFYNACPTVQALQRLRSLGSDGHDRAIPSIPENTLGVMIPTCTCNLIHETSDQEVTVIIVHRVLVSTCAKIQLVNTCHIAKKEYVLYTFTDIGVCRVCTQCREAPWQRLLPKETAYFHSI
jgi:hypothetical protein